MSLISRESGTVAFGSGVRHLIGEAITWTVVIAAGFGVVFFFDDIRSVLKGATAAVQQTYEAQENEPQQVAASSGFDRSVHLRANSHGHFAVKADINGRDIALMADTGATYVALTYEDARDAGFTHNDLQFTSRSRTANGIANMAMVTLDWVRVGDIEVRNVRAMVAEPGKLHISLLGMSFLRRLASFEMRGSKLVLNQ